MSDPTPCAPLSILVVDDEPDMEMMVRQMFRARVRRGQYALSFAGDGVEALERIDAGPPVDLVITDINMPRMTGSSCWRRCAIGAPTRSPSWSRPTATWPTFAGR